jgi:hypothetical protein
MSQIPENKQQRRFLIANPTRIGVPSENRERGTSLRPVEACKRPPEGGRYETKYRIGPARNRGKITGLVPKHANTRFAGCVRVDGAAARLADDLEPAKKQGAEAAALHYLSVSRARQSTSAEACGPHEARATCDREAPLRPSRSNCSAPFATSFRRGRSRSSSSRESVREKRGSSA